MLARVLFLPRSKAQSADELHVKASKIPLLVGLARSKQDTIPMVFIPRPASRGQIFLGACDLLPCMTGWPLFACIQGIVAI